MRPLPIGIRTRRVLGVATLAGIVTLVVLKLMGRHGEGSILPADLLDAAPPPATMGVSRFSVPLDYDFTAVLRTVERVVPTRFGSIDSVRAVPGDDRKHYAFAADREAFTAFADGDLLHIRATLAYTARGFYKPVIGPTLSAGCGKDGERPRIVVELATPLTLTASWHLKSRIKLVRVEPATSESRDRCDVTKLHIDVTNQVISAATTAITARLASIDRTIADVDLSRRFDELWRILSEPIRLSDGVWLVLGPEALAIGQMHGKGRVLTVPVSLDAYPRIVVAAEAPAVSANAIPKLGRDTAAAPGFRVILDAAIDYATASAGITFAFAGRPLEQGGHTVQITDVRVSPLARGRLAIDVDFTGDAKGTLRLAGTPALDSARNEVAVPDLDFDLDTDSELLDTYSWLKSEDLRATFREKARVSVAPALAKAKDLLLSGLNRKVGKALTLSATVDSVAIRAVFATRNGLVVRAEASGQAGVAVKQR